MKGAKRNKRERKGNEWKKDEGMVIHKERWTAILVKKRKENLEARSREEENKNLRNCKRAQLIQ